MDCRKTLSVSSTEITQQLMGLRESIRNQTDVALGITKKVLLNEGKDSNVVFSPLSINMLLSLITAGSKGPTRDQLLFFLKSKSNDQLQFLASQLIAMFFADGEPKGGPRLSFANGAWVDRSLSLKPSFKQVVDNTYKAALDQVDFQTKAAEVRREVNSWAEKETSGLIKEVLPPGSVDNETRLVLANALYFKGTWNQKFDASATKEYDFYLLNGSSVEVPFMTSKYVSGIFHKSFIEVNEEGTEAAAISAATVQKRRSVRRIEKIDFVADHPFLFLIREDRSGMILFVGHVINPIAIPPAPAKQNESDLPHVVIPPPPAKHIERERFFQEKKMDGFGLSGHVRGHSLDSHMTSSSRSGSTNFSD